jgi:hypothetical protein
MHSQKHRHNHPMGRRHVSSNGEQEDQKCLQPYPRKMHLVRNVVTTVPQLSTLGASKKNLNFYRIKLHHGVSARPTTILYQEFKFHKGQQKFISFLFLRKTTFTHCQYPSSFQVKQILFGKVKNTPTKRLQH